jgi:uncharacterized cupredoxin-like copper-binding protein
MPRAAALLVALTALAAACAPAVPEADISKGQIRADMREHTIALTSNTVKAGTVTFIVRNIGTTAHDLIVLKTDAAADKLAVDQQTQKAKEDGRVGGVEEVPPGQTRNLRVDLQAGHYLVICNVPTHYQLGMRAELTVQ